MAYINKRVGDLYLIVENALGKEEVDRVIWRRLLATPVSPERELDARAAIRSVQHQSRACVMDTPKDWQELVISPTASRDIGHRLEAAGWRIHDILLGQQ